MSSSVAWRAAGRRDAICGRGGGREVSDEGRGWTAVDLSPARPLSALRAPPVVPCRPASTAARPPESRQRALTVVDPSRLKLPRLRPRAILHPRRRSSMRGAQAGVDRACVRQCETHCVWKGELARGRARAGGKGARRGHAPRLSPPPVATGGTLARTHGRTSFPSLARSSSLRATLLHSHGQVTHKSRMYTESGLCLSVTLSLASLDARPLTFTTPL